MEFINFHNVVIIGSGPCGMAVASHLRKNNISSLVLEAGHIPSYFMNEKRKSMEDYRNGLSASLEVSDEIWSYEKNSCDYDHIRCRNAGGRSLRWNGWLAEPSRRNFLDRESGKWIWPIDENNLLRLFEEAKSFLGATQTNLSWEFKRLGENLGENVLPKLAALGRISSRPFYALDGWFSNNSSIEIKTNTICMEVSDSEYANYKIKCFQNDIKKEINIHANIIVFAASPFETTRLLFNSFIFDKELPIGENYCDHIASSFLAIIPKPFSGEKIPYPTERGATIPELKSLQNDIYQAGYTAEIHGPNSPSVYEKEVLDAAGLTSLSNVTCYSVNIIGELLSKKNRYIAPSDSYDAIGRRKFKVVLHWDEEEVDLSRRMEAEGMRIALSLAENGYAVKVRKTLSLGGTGTSHESSVCRMGLSPFDSVVDINGKIFGTSNAYIADASQMPSALDCHPTLTAVALAINTAKSIVSSISKTH